MEEWAAYLRRTRRAAYWPDAGAAAIIGCRRTQDLEPRGRRLVTARAGDAQPDAAVRSSQTNKLRRARIRAAGRPHDELGRAPAGRLGRSPMVRLTQSFCCARCFNHRALKRYVRNHGTPNRACDYCAAMRVHVVEIGELTTAFQNFMDLFDKDDDSLDTLMSYADGWGIFSVRHDGATAVHLFNEIANAAWDDDDGEPPVDAADYYRRRRTVSDEWDVFCEEVKRDPTTPFPLDEYMHEEFGRRLVIVPAGSALFRARLGCVDEDGVLVPYRGTDIGAPPTVTSSGRAHRPPERVLYVADEEATCVAEVRPARGMNVSICTMTPTRDLRIVALSLSGNWPDPFFIDEPLYHMDMEALLVALGEQMALPLRRDDDETHYLPCQLLADFVRDGGYDGIRYPSALRPRGTNVVLFDPDAVAIGKSKLIRIRSISLLYKEED